MNNTNYSTNHPLISNTGEYVKYKKIVSIHSEDRNITKYPLASQFEIELPNDLINIESVKLVSWSFPSNYDVFSVSNKNLELTFTFPSIANINIPITNTSPPPSPAITDTYLLTLPTVYNILVASVGIPFYMVIQSGSYSPVQLATELTNKFNDTVTQYIYNQMIAQGYADVNNFIEGSDSYPGGYNGFVVQYNDVSSKMWFGNNICQFEILTSLQVVNQSLQDLSCIYKQLPDFSNFGLPSNLGLGKLNILATPAGSFREYIFQHVNYRIPIISGGSGYWIGPSDIWFSSTAGTPGIVYYIQAPNKINLMGHSHFYMDISELNNIDETSPYNLSQFTRQTNMTNGRVESAFAKVAIAGLPLSLWYDTNAEGNYKLFDPPAERIRRLNITIRYHNGMLVDFETFNYSFCLEFTVLNGYISKKYNMRR
jgi:hypothetical protein